MAVCGAVTSLLAHHPGTLSGMGLRRVKRCLTCCLLQCFGLSSAQMLRGSPIPWTTVLGVPAHQGAASSTSVLHHLHLLMGLMEDAWAQAHHGPGVAGVAWRRLSCTSKPVTMTQGEPEHLQDQIPWLPSS